MTDPAATPSPETPSGPPSVAERLAIYQRAGGIITPLLTAVVAFLVGGLVVLATGHDPISTYKGIWEGTGLTWVPDRVIRLFGGAGYLTLDERILAEINLQLTLIVTTPLILTGLAVAFAFRCGLFNIGGQGQYLIGAIVAVWVGSSWAGLAGGVHIVVAIVLAMLAGALWAGIAGFLKATVGAHEVITTIMLNWIAYWIGSYAFGQGGPLQNDVNPSAPISNDIQRDARLNVFFGEPELQGLHVGFFIALAALVVFHVIINRTTLGYEVRAVGFNPEAARYGGINVPRNYFVAMAIAGLFAGLGGALDILGWQFRLGVLDVQSTQIGYIGIAVALLGRNTAIGVGLGALLFGALLTGTSTRTLDPAVFPPELAGNLTLMIQGLVLLFVGADLLILYLWQARRKLGLARRVPAREVPT